MSDFDDVFVSVETKEPAQSKEERRAAPKEWWQIREQKEREQAYSSLDRIFADFSGVSWIFANYRGVFSWILP